jgi:aryl-alcohol dehydrogenase-like predicted oxidoreductase
MRYRKLGRSGLVVSELCLGTNMFGGGNSEFWKLAGGLEQKAVNAVVAAAVEGGINFIDTADHYAEGESEMRVGQAIKDLGIDRSSITICSKFGIGMTMTGGIGSLGYSPAPNESGASRGYILKAIDRSLKRLGADYIDVYLVHVFDPATPLEETLRALDTVVKSGKVRYIGCSNFQAWEIMKGLGISEREGLERFQVAECHWSIATREVEREVVPFARSEGIGLMTWGALLSGVLTGKYRRDGSSNQPGRFGGKIPAPLNHDKVHDIVDVLRPIAEAHNVTPGEIALAFLLHQYAGTIAIFGSTKPEQVKSNMRASDVKLSAEELKKLNEVSALTPDFGSMTNFARIERSKYL